MGPDQWWSDYNHHPTYPTYPSCPSHVSFMVKKLGNILIYITSIEDLSIMHSVVGDIIVISGLAIRVQTAFKDAPHGFRHISEEVEALQVLIDKATQYLKNTAIISSDNRHEGQRVLKGCQSVLEDLNSLFEKYKRRAFTNRRLPFLGVKLGKENIISLQERLIFNTGLLHGFVRRFVVQIVPSTYGY